MTPWHGTLFTGFEGSLRIPFAIRWPDNIPAGKSSNEIVHEIDGMEGDMVKDPESLFKGKRMKNGWKNSGMPWTYKINPEKMRLPMYK